MHFIEVRIAGTEYRFETDDLKKFQDVCQALCEWIQDVEKESD